MFDFLLAPLEFLAAPLSVPSHPVLFPVVSDMALYSPAAVALRVGRRARLIGQSEAFHTLWELPPYRSHLAYLGEHDPAFFLSHRHFLARGLSGRQRLSAALHHYRHENSCFDDGYFDAVYRGGGLTLWRETVAGVAYAIVLRPGNDVGYEGGLSLVFTVDGERVALLSFSTVPRAVVGAPGAGDVVFVTRKQLTRNLAYQAAFSRAFDRTTPAHLCLGALAGLAEAQGRTDLFAIAPEAHPSYCADLAARFQSGYGAFWAAEGGAQVSPLGFALPLPLHGAGTEHLTGKHRKRTLQRRAHAETARTAATAAIASHLRPGFAAAA